MSQKKKVALCVGLSHMLGRGIIQGFCPVAQVEDWELMAIDSAQIDQVVEWRPDALVLTWHFMDALRQLRRQRRRVLAVGVELDGPVDVPVVRVDNRAAGREAARHLLGTGLRSFGYFGYGTGGWARERIEGFCEEIHRHGLPVHLLEIDEMETTQQRSARADPEEQFRRWVRSAPLPMGVLAGCDTWGHTLITYCRRARKRVPEDLAVVAVDNDELFCGLLRPSLSSVRIPWVQVGAVLAKLVKDLLHERPVPRTPPLIPPAGVASRQSSDVSAIPDVDVAAALRVIGDHAAHPLTVADILQQVPAARHRLERGFRRYLGRTMHEEIRRVHIDTAKHLLATTSLPLSAIAEQSGFASAKKLGIAFRVEMSQTPTAYRDHFRS